MDTIDETDLKILRILQDNSKTTTREIAEILNLSPSPVYERTRKLESKGYIKKYVAILDKKLIQRPITVICMVSLRYHDEGFIDKLFTMIAKGRIDSKVKKMMKDDPKLATAIKKSNDANKELKDILRKINN